MNPRTTLSRNRARYSLAGVVLGLPLVLAACAPTTTAAPETAAAASTQHVHEISIDRVTTNIILATHDGLYDATDRSPVLVGTDAIDLMGFTATAEPQVFYASGHPGPSSTLSNPVGLIRSTDAGKTWEPVSLQKRSDFHALTASGNSLVAFDGQLRTSTDGTTWDTSSATFVPMDLAGSPATTVVLATTEAGLQRSTNSGMTWATVAGAPILRLAAFAASDERAPTEAVGVGPDGSVHVSTDAGLTWTPAGKVEGQVQAVTALAGTAGKPGIWVATAEGVQRSSDGGATFAPAIP